MRSVWKSGFLWNRKYKTKIFEGLKPKIKKPNSFIFKESSWLYCEWFLRNGKADSFWFCLLWARRKMYSVRCFERQSVFHRQREVSGLGSDMWRHRMAPNRANSGCLAHYIMAQSLRKDEKSVLCPFLFIRSNNKNITVSFLGPHPYLIGVSAIFTVPSVTPVQIFAHISSYFQFLRRKYGAKPFGTLRPATYTLWKYVCGSFAYLYCHGRQKKNEKSLSYHFHSNVTQKVMNDAQREIKGMWCYFKEILISLKSRLWCTESVFYIGQVLPRNTEKWRVWVR